MNDVDDFDDPASRTIHLNISLLGGPVEAMLIDPASGVKRPLGVYTGNAALTTPGQNADGKGNWLIVTRRAAALSLGCGPSHDARPAP
jgi:hypothetical protein